MRSIAFIDIEIDCKSRKILDLGAIDSNGRQLHKYSVAELVQFVKGVEFLCGHNIIYHDLKYLRPYLEDGGLRASKSIDTLFLSPLLFPNKPYHALVKDDKLQSDDLNNPFNDACKAKDLFFSEVAAFDELDERLKAIFYLLLSDAYEFRAFFEFINYSNLNADPVKLIHEKFENLICEHADVARLTKDFPVQLAYCLALINTNSRFSITPPWVLRNYPDVPRIMYLLCNNACIEGCQYCEEKLNIHNGMKRIFGHSAFRIFGGEALQEKAVKAAVDNTSLLAVFPTGGGKSITFQLPALMAGETIRGLTVVISPLQSLMKDQVDNLEKIGITSAVTINGLLDPIERSKSLERVEDGSASLLYISPESLRSRTIERVILNRTIARFVIDEAHCFSSWGQDFRVDYLYIGDFIKSIQQQKNLQEGIPVSCFTATAKQKVIEDIREYFTDKLSIDLKVFSSKTSRTNLTYSVVERDTEEEKYQSVRDLIDQKKCPAIIYVSRTHKAEVLAARLNKDGFNASAYHGKMDGKEKTANQNAFVNGAVPIMVATSAFGMGVDKKNVGLVIHYEISDSLENYVQEAGRAGRDENITADCLVLFNEEDLSKHFILLNQTKLSIKEIQQIWKAIKDITHFRSTVSNSALEIARKAGWDDNVMDIETRVTTAIAALEDAGYVRRGQNMPRIFANSILCKNVQEAIDKINASTKFGDNQKEKAIRIIRKLISSKSKNQSTGEAAESRVDYISDHLGIVKEEVINIVTLLREEGILADEKDLTAFIQRGANSNKSLKIVECFARLENFLLPLCEEQEKTFQSKEINEAALLDGCESTPGKIKTIINFWAINNWIKRQSLEYSGNHFSLVCLYPRIALKEKLERRHNLARFIIELLFEKIRYNKSEESDEVSVEFSVHELKQEFERRAELFETKASIEDIEDALFYLSRIDSLKIEGGFLVTYNRLNIERLERTNSKRYTQEDYGKLNEYYQNKVQQIHIVGEYAKKMIADYKDALQFVDDYFQLNYSAFLRRHFPGSRLDDLKMKMTPGKFKQLFGELSATQLNIIKDKAKYMAVLAGPGSGKTKVLVHKLASLLLMEDVKHEQLLMVTFSRAAATEFKKRLLKLIGNAAAYVEIKTFHSYCFDLLGMVGSVEKSDVILKKTIEKIKTKDVEINRITKTVLVIDEAQDMDEDEFNLIRALMEQNEEMRVIAVGDDDQNIYEFRGASSKYLEKIMQIDPSAKHELVTNYRSKNNLVEFANQFVQRIAHRLKSFPIVAVQPGDGQIKLFRYQTPNLIIPLVQHISTERLAGTSCVLTKTNDEALQITGLLLKHGVHAKLIQTNDGFSLSNLVEVKFFMSLLKIRNDGVMISDETWDHARQELLNRYQKSTKIDICKNIIEQFEDVQSKRKYQSDFEMFVRESKLEDFYNENGETIFVSTIHKAKGKEFDNVFLMLASSRHSNLDSDAKRRELYVAMTRAKTNLFIHTDENYLDDIKVGNLEVIKDGYEYDLPNEIIVNLSFRDVWLDFFGRKQRLIEELTSGDELILGDNECLNASRQVVLKFSSGFIRQIEGMKERGYELKQARVNFIVNWMDAKANQAFMVVLPEVLFRRK